MNGHPKHREQTAGYSPEHATSLLLAYQESFGLTSKCVYANCTYSKMTQFNYFWNLIKYEYIVAFTKNNLNTSKRLSKDESLSKWLWKWVLVR